MSTYNENLQVTTSDVLLQMQNEKQRLKSINQAAEYKLYFAQSANIVANEKLNAVKQQYDFACKLDDQGVQNDNIAVNVLASATQANADVGTSVTNTSVAASNIQIAANAVTELAADVASAFSYIGAETHTKELYSLAETAINQIQETAYMAERISEYAMIASAATAEIQTGQLLSATAVAKADIENLLKATEAEYTGLAAKQTTDTKAVGSTSNAEYVAEGELENSTHQLRALEESFNTTKSQLNFSLDVKVRDQSSIDIYLSGFRQPFPHWNEPRPPFSAFDSTTGKNPDRPLDPPEANPSYYGIFVEAQDAQLFTLSKAEMIFDPEDVKGNKGPFFELKQKSGKPIPVPQKPGEYAKPACIEYVLPDDGKADSNGRNVVAGKRYVLFVYIQLSHAYKKFVNDFHDLMSAPSEPFVFATKLEAATDFAFHWKESAGAIAAQIRDLEEKLEEAEKEFKKARSDEDKRNEIDKERKALNKAIKALENERQDLISSQRNDIHFLVPGAEMKEGLVEYYGILLPSNPPTSHKFLTKKFYSESGRLLKDRLKFFFNKEIALNLSPANMTQAVEDLGAPIPDEPGRIYKISFNDATIDNFGSQLVPNAEYLLVVLSVVQEGKSDPDAINEYVNSMSSIRHAPTIVFDEQLNISHFINS